MMCCSTTDLQSNLLISTAAGALLSAELQLESSMATHAPPLSVLGSLKRPRAADDCEELEAILAARHSRSLPSLLCCQRPDWPACSR